jgi:diguanylate cyclase (GGDEF)-like protein
MMSSIQQPDGAPMEPDGEPDQTQRISLAKVHAASRTKSAGLVVIEGMSLGSIYVLDRGSYLIGRSPDAHIHIDNFLVSRFHAELRVNAGDPPHCVLRDLDSTNGTLVNDDRVEERLLQDGDKIRIGDHVLKYVYQDEQDLKFHARVHEMIRYDDLTGLLAKSSFYKELSREISRARRRGNHLSVLMMDLDYFKSVNDTHGHLVGSAVLAQIGILIRDTFRGEDMSGRYGGEEFITFFPETSKTDAIRGAERFRKRIAEHVFRYRDVRLQITISIGIATMPEDGCGLEALIQRADLALYEAKDMGRNLVRAYHEGLAPRGLTVER